MKLLIKQRVFSFVDTFDIYDEYGNCKYTVQNEFLRFMHHLHVYNAHGHEIGSVDQRFTLFMPQFDITVLGQYRGSITREFTFMAPSYKIDYKGLTCEGDLFGWNYEVRDGLKTVACISKRWLSWGDTYDIEIINPEDELVVLMLVIAIDAVNCSNN